MVSHTGCKILDCCFAALIIGLARGKKPPCQPACGLQDDRHRPNVEKRHLVLQAFLDLASRNSLNSIPISLDCCKVRQKYRLRSPSAFAAVIDHLMTILLKAIVKSTPNMPRTPCAATCQSKHGPVSAHFDLASLFGIVLQRNLVIPQARVLGPRRCMVKPVTT